MVVTRKRNCTATEAPAEASSSAKVRKQDDSDGKGKRTPAGGSSTGDVDSSVTPRRTRRVTDTETTSSPRTSLVKHRLTLSDNEGNDKEARKEATRSQSNTEAAGGSTGQRESLKCVVKLKDVRTLTPLSLRSKTSGEKDIPTVPTPTRRSRRLSGVEDVSGGEKDGKDTAGASTPSVATPSRRSRRLSGAEDVAGGVKDGKDTAKTLTSSVSTPSKRSRRLSGVEDVIKDEKDCKDTAGASTSSSSVSTPSRRSRRLSNSGLEDVTKGEKDTKGTAGTSTPKRSRRLSGSGVEDAAGTTTPSVSTPTRRSRRLSDSGSEDGTKQDTSRKSYSIARILGETAKDESLMKRKILPVIEEDSEQPDRPDRGSPGKEAGKLVSDKEEEEEEEEEEVVSTKLSKDIAEECDSQTKEEPDTTTSVSIVGNDEAKTTVDSTTDNGKSVSTSDVPMDVPTEITESNGNRDTKNEGSKLPDPRDSQEQIQILPSYENCNAVNSSQGTPLDENSNKAQVNGVASQPPRPAGEKKAYKVIPEMEKKIDQLRSIPKGRPISGRCWKEEKKRFRSINKDATGKKSWSKKMQIKRWREDVLAKSAAIEADKQKKKEELKERQKLNKERREENARKAEVVELIKDPRKIKKMKRKQLRYLQMRDTTNMSQA